MLLKEDKEKFKTLKIRIWIHEAAMLFLKEKEKFKFSEFEFGFCWLPCYFRKERKGLHFLDRKYNSWGTPVILERKGKVYILWFQNWFHEGPILF